MNVPLDQALDWLRTRRVAVIGYGSQGHAHALNLRDSGVAVSVAQRPGPRYDAAIADGFSPVEIEAAVRDCDLLVLGLPDSTIGAVFADSIAPRVRAGQAIGLLHGFAVHYRTFAPPPTIDIVMVAPKAQGHGVRREFAAGRGVFALLAVAQDATGHAWDAARGWAAGIGCARAGVLETTFRDETETDLFGEQAVLCGGLNALIHAAFDTLTAAGYPPELAYFECCHELKLVADLVHEGGITHMRRRISSTALFGDVTRGTRIIDDGVRRRMAEILAEIRGGAFAREFLADAAAGNTHAQAQLAQDAAHPIEAVGARLRAMLTARAGDASRSDK